VNAKFIHTNLRRGLVISLYLIAVSFPFSYRLSNPWIVLMVVFWVFERILRPKKDQLEELKRNPINKISFYSFIALFVWTAISLSYTDNLELGLKNLEGKLSLLAFPIVLYNFRLAQKEVWNILKAFIISISLATLYLLVNSFIHYLDQGSWLTYHDFVGKFSGHAVFYSYYLFTSIVLSIFMLLDKKKGRAINWFYGSSILIAMLGLLFCASKNVTVVSIFFGMLILFKKYFSRGIRLKEGINAIGIVLVVAFLAIQLGPVKQRMAELFSGSGMENYQKIKKGEAVVAEDIDRFNGTSVRLTFWYIGLSELEREESWLLGLSPGDRRDQINQRYEEVGLLKYYENYNLHNQFIQTLVEVGLIGLLIYLSLYFSLVSSAIKKGNLLFLIFIFASLIFQMTESILERNKGIVFFVFFLCFLQQLNQPQDENRYSRN